MGLASAVVGLVFLLFTFVMAYSVFQTYKAATPSSDLTSSMGTLLLSAMQALFLGVMGWVGSLLMLRGIDFEKVERGVGVVTFKVDKGVGIVTQQPEPETKGS
jgi:cell division protein FtsX